MSCKTFASLYVLRVDTARGQHYFTCLFTLSLYPLPFTLYPHHTSVHVTFDSIHDTAACSFGDCLGDQAAQICIRSTLLKCVGVLRSADPRAQVSGVALLLLRLGIKGFFFFFFFFFFFLFLILLSFLLLFLMSVYHLKLAHTLRV